MVNHHVQMPRLGTLLRDQEKSNQQSCGNKFSTIGSNLVANRYTSTAGQTSCAVCPQGSIVSDDYTSCTSCITLQNSQTDSLIGPAPNEYYCRGDRNGVEICNDDASTQFRVQYAGNWDQPCVQRLCSCPNGNPQVGSECSGKDSEECTTCDAGSGLYNKTDSQTGAIVWTNSTHAEKVCRTCSRPLFNNVPNTISACSVEHCPLGEGYPSTAPDMSAMTSADDHDGSFAGVICAACPPGSYSDSNAIGQCSKIPSGYGCANNSKAYISTQDGLNADGTTNYTALRDLGCRQSYWSSIRTSICIRRWL